MATATSAGVNYSVPPNVNGSGASNNHGAAAKVGTVTTLLDNVAISKDNTGVFGSTVVDGNDTDKAISAGSIAHNHVKPISQKITTEIAGQVSSVLSNTANDPTQLRSINKRESFKSAGTATAIRAGYFNLYTGRFSPAPTPVTETPGTDTAAAPTRSAPGDLVFRTGAKLPVRNVDYSAKTG
jgi:hypothetical protein